MTGPPVKAAVPDAIAKILDRAVKQRSKKQTQLLINHFTSLDPNVKKLVKQLAAIQKQIDAIKPITTLVMIEQEQSRDSAIFRRGNFLQRGESVQMGLSVDTSA